MPKNRSLAATSLLAVSALVIAGCSTGEATEKDPGSASTITVEDNAGSQSVSVPPASVVALDNRSFETLDSWDVDLSAGAVTLMPDTVSYVEDDSILDIGSHTEPKLELIVEANPSLVINGQRFTQHQDDIADLVPDATIINLEPREGEPLDAELKRQTTTLGEIFGKEAEAEQLVADFDAAVEKAKTAYQIADSVMAVTVSGGEIGYIAPGVGRTLGPVFDLLALTPALEVEGATSDHQGDDISVEAIADSNPAWILVMDRDAAISADDASYTPAADVLENSEALANVTAIDESQVIYMPADTYTNEGIQTYTEFLNDFADALEAAK